MGEKFLEGEIHTQRMGLVVPQGWWLERYDEKGKVEYVEGDPIAVDVLRSDGPGWSDE